MDYKLKRASQHGLGLITGKIPKHFYPKSLPLQHQGPSDTITLPLFESAEQQQQRIMSANHASSICPPLIYPKLGGFFSLEQWHELELQAFIFKFMLAGAAVPDELAQLIRKSLPNTPTPTSVPHDSSQQRSKPTTPRDTEPGRCRRTDGRKWRCARDVVEGANYCERHWHRGRSKKARGDPRARQSQQTSRRNGTGDSCSSAFNNGVRWNSSYCSSSAPSNGVWTSVGTHRLPLGGSSWRIDPLRLGKGKEQSS